MKHKTFLFIVLVLSLIFILSICQVADETNKSVTVVAAIPTMHLIDPALYQGWQREHPHDLPPHR